MSLNKIDDAGFMVEKTKMHRRRRLPELEIGESALVSGFEGEEGQRFRLMEMGVLEGTRITLVRRAPLGDPIEVELRGFHLSLRVSEAECIEVEGATS